MQDIFDLSHFDEYREGNRLEVKKASGGLPRSLWDTYSSFSNCNGGVIILGVKEREDGSWYTTHLQNRNKLLTDFWNTINNRSKVSVNLLNEGSVETYELNGDVIIVIYVAKADRVYKPVYINNDIFGGTFRRDHEGDYHCSESEIRGMLRDQAEKGTDSKILLNKDLSIFYPDTVKSFRTRHKAVNPDHVWHRLDDDDYLERIGAASISDVDGKLHPTAAGLLMFGEEYKIRQEFPEYFLDYREMLDPSIRWTDRLESSSGEWSGNLLDFFFQMERKLFRDLKKPFKLEGIVRVDETPVHKAIREALANCMANADFNFPRGIVILKSPNEITIENPGSIITGKAQMLKGGISEPRNKTIIKMFNLIRIGERAGSGVPDIFSIWDEAGWVPPTVEEIYKPDRTVLTLSFAEKQMESGKNRRIQQKQADSAKTGGFSKNRRIQQKQADSAKTSGFSKNRRIQQKQADSAKTGGFNKNRRIQQKQADSTKTSGFGKTADNKKAIVDYIIRKRKAKTVEIAGAVGLSPSRARVLLAELTDEGKVEPIGNAKARVYVTKQ
ncbi:MAG: putative DNA binding domain-containing protein [Thermoguttaceae bacterium]|nr:putative DNA binding domain-containing protein [Thermoguttaceae bacterium]